MPSVPVNDGAQPGIPTKFAPSELHELLLMKIADGMMSIATAIEIAHAAATDRRTLANI